MPRLDLRSIAALALALAGCAPRTAPAVAPAPVAVARDPFRESNLTFERVALRRYRLSLEIPDPKGWRPERGVSRFARLDHDVTGSTLVVRTWLEQGLMTAKGCEEGARLFREFPRGGEVLASERRVVAGFDAAVRVAVEAKASDATGYVTAFGSRGRACLAFAFSTRAAGADARLAVEERLALFDERTLAALRPDGFDEDALRELAPR